MHDAPTDVAGDWFRTFATTIRRRWAVVLLCVVLVPALAYAYTQTQRKTYQATATILVRDPADASALVGAGGPSTNFAANAIGTDTSVASLNVIGDHTARALGRRVLPGSVTTGNNGSSNLLTVTATEGGPLLAAKVANTYAQQYIAFQTQTNLAHIATEEADLHRELRNPAASAAAAQSAAQLATLASLQNTTMQVVGAATPPTSASSPKPTQMVVAGVVVGLLLGLGLAVMLEQLDRRLWSPGDVEASLGAPILGEIPRSRLVADGSRAGGSGPSGIAPEPFAIRDDEAFAMLYANILHYPDRQVRSLVVTSAAGGEGKSTVALNLARTAARAGGRVLLIEADLRHPTLASRLGVEVEGAPGLVDILAHEASLSEVIHPIPLLADETSEAGDGDDEDRVEPGRPLHRVLWEALNGPIPDGFTLCHRNGDQDDNRLQNLDLVEIDGSLNGSPGAEIVDSNGHRNGSGRVTHVDLVFTGRVTASSNSSAGLNPFRLLASSQMRDLIRVAERAYDLVVIDSPPASFVSDAIPLMKCVSGVLVVSRVQQNTRDSARRLRDHLSNLRVPTLGVVVNGVEPAEGYRESVRA